MIVITSKKFKASDWYNTDGGTEFINGCIMDKTILTLEGYIIKTIPAMMVKFTAADKTIKNSNDIDFRSFIKDGEFQVGEKIIFPDSVSNNTALTITAITDRIITVSDVLVNETCRQTDAFISSKISAIDYYYNLANVDVNERKQFQKWNSELPTKSDMQSKIDPSVLQKYSLEKGFDASDTITIQQFIVGSEKYDWVTDTLEGDITECTIVGMGITSYKQKFKIVHTFLQTPLWTNNQVANFQNRIAPNNFLKNDCPTYIFGIEGKYDWFSQIPAVSFLDKTTVGRMAWYNQNVYKKLPTYTFDEILYEDADTSDILNRLDLSKTHDVTIHIKSSAGKFEAGSKFILGFCYCALSEATYQTASRTLRQNNANDRAIVIEGAGVVNGDLFGTAAQIITNATVAVIDANNAILTFTASFTTAAKNILNAFSLSDLNYAFTVATQDIDIVSSSEIDRVNIICDFQNMDYDQSNPDLLALVDNFKCYTSPNTSTPFNNISDFEGKNCIVEVPFQISIAGQVPILEKCGIEIVAVKNGKTDFILESKIINTSSFTFTDSVQQIDFFETKGYKLDPTSPFNFVSLAPYATYDDDNIKGYLLHYAFKLRNESWQINDAIQPGLQYDILRDIPIITNRWADLISHGWTLKIRFVASVLDYKGITTDFIAKTDLNVLKQDAVAGDGIEFTKEIYFLDSNNVKVDTIIKNGKTKIITVFTPVSKNVLNQVVCASIAATTHYEFDLPKTDITTGSATFVLVETFTDNSDGTLTGSLGGSGTINYITGHIVLDFNSAPTFPGNITGTYSYNPLANLNTDLLFGTIALDSTNASGGPTKTIYGHTNEQNSQNTVFAPNEPAESATSSWVSDTMTMNVFGKVSVSIETIYTDESSTFGAIPCEDVNSGVVPGFPFTIGGAIAVTTHIGTTPDSDARQWEDLSIHNWEDNVPAGWE